MKKKKYTEDDVKILTRSLLTAAAFMHNAGIAHRDIKPQNFLLRPEDRDSQIKITGFGFARRVHTKNSLTSRCGSPTFVAPEILKNIPHDERCDLWSIGVIIYLLLVGYPPFASDSQAELFKQIRTCEWRFYEDDWQNISPDARELIQNLLVADPEQRWTANHALKCSWLQYDSDENKQTDLTVSIKSLRDRRARLRRFSVPVEWQNDKNSPVDSLLQKK